MNLRTSLALTLRLLTSTGRRDFSAWHGYCIVRSGTYTGIEDSAPTNEESNGRPLWVRRVRERNLGVVASIGIRQQTTEGVRSSAVLHLA